jgi:hypothetical protein
VHKERIIEWIEKDLTPPDSRFNNLPRCPYAKRAVMDNKILFVNVLKDKFYKEIQKAVKEWDDSYDIACFNLDYKITPKAVEQLRMICNEGYAHKVLMQRKTNIDKARAQLKTQGYYAGDPQ